MDSSAITEEDGRVASLTECSSNQFNLKSSSLFFEGRRIPFFSKGRRRVFKLPNFSSLAEEKFSPLYLKRGAFDFSYLVFSTMLKGGAKRENTPFCLKPPPRPAATPPKEGNFLPELRTLNPEPRTLFPPPFIPIAIGRGKAEKSPKQHTPNPEPLKQKIPQRELRVFEWCSTPIAIEGTRDTSLMWGNKKTQDFRLGF